MSDDQKIWFLYITDHHEGPFNAGEVAERLQQGIVTAQNLGWKDGMPEWVPLETIPELQGLLSEQEPSATELKPLGGAPQKEEPTLAQMLAASQGGGIGEEGTDGGVSLLSAEALAESDPPKSATQSGLIAVMAGGSSSIKGSIEPSEKEVVWTLCQGQQVIGLLSMQQMVAMASNGEMPDDAQVWHPGWNDYRPVSAISPIASVKKSFRGQSAKSLPVAPMATGQSSRPRGLSPITAGANIGDDEPTDPEFRADGPKGFKKILAKLQEFFKKKIKAGGKASPVVDKKKAGAGKVTASGKGGVTKGKNSLAGLTRILGISLGVAIVVGGGAYYYMFFMSVIPRNLDVAPDAMEAMNALIEQKPDAGGGKFYLAMAKGSEENPSDETNPKFYVATNLPVGTSISLQITGVQGTLVNRLSLEKAFSASVTKGQYAIFEDFRDDGKPIPMGDYKVKISAEGAKPLETMKFLGGKKGAVYEKRLKQYKDKLQGDYDKEMSELRELVSTLKTLQTELSNKMVEYKGGAPHAKLAIDWRAYYPTFQGLAGQMEQKIKDYNGQTGVTRYHPRTLQDISTTLTQMTEWAQMHQQRIEGMAVSGNIDEKEGLVEAGVVSLDKWVSEAILKGPFETQKTDQPGTAATPAPVVGAKAAPAKTAAPAAASSPTTPAPTAPAPAADPVQK